MLGHLHLKDPTALARTILYNFHVIINDSTWQYASFHSVSGFNLYVCVCRLLEHFKESNTASLTSSAFLKKAPSVDQ